MWPGEGIRWSFLVHKIFKKFLKNVLIKDEFIFEKYNFKITQRSISTRGTTRDGLTERLQSVRENASLLYNRMMENMGYGRERLKDIVEKETEEEFKEQQQETATAKEEEKVKNQQQGLAAATEQQQDDKQYETVPKIKSVHEGKQMKVFRVTGNLNKSNTKMIMDNITPQIKFVYSFKSEIHWCGAEIVDYSKTLTSPLGFFTSLEEIQAYIEECEQKRLDLDNKEVWSKAYLPAKRTIEARGNYEGKVHTNKYCHLWYIEQGASIFSRWKPEAFDWITYWDPDREAKKQ